MNTLNVDDYEEMAAAFQCFQIQTLYQTLKNNKIDETLIRKICEQFTLSMGVALDQNWIESKCDKVFPVIAFTKTHPDYEPEGLYLNNGMFSFSEYAIGNISWFFEDHQPSESPQKFGCVGEDGKPTINQSWSAPNQSHLLNSSRIIHSISSISKKQSLPDALTYLFTGDFDSVIELVPVGFIQ